MPDRITIVGITIEQPRRYRAELSESVAAAIPPTLPKSDLETQEGLPRRTFSCLSLMYFYSGLLMQF